MIICTNRMEYPLRNQRTHTQVMNSEKDRVSLLLTKTLVSRGGLDPVSLVSRGGLDPVSLVSRGGLDPVSLVSRGGLDPVSLVSRGGLDPVSLVSRGGLDPVSLVSRGGLDPVSLVSRGGLDPVSQQMALHPQYLESFLRTQHYILHMDGPLPLPYRHYIAIMAAAQHHCHDLVFLHSAQFLRVGGDPLWLQGLEAAPPRLRLLDHINKVLAHQPWLTACSHIQTLLKSGEQCWSLAELVHAVVLLAHCHSLCSFVFGCDTDLVALSKSPNGTPPAYCSFDAANGNANVPQSLSAQNEHVKQRQSLDSTGDVMFVKDRIHKSQDECEKKEERFLQTDVDVEDEQEDVCCCADLTRFITEPDFCYQEFTRREEHHFQVFRVQDYSWEDHGFSLVNRLYSDIGHLLDDRFRSVTSLPSLLSPDLKRAVWNYIHCVLGIRYDDYDYGEVNHLLEPDLKLYIKTVACVPDATKAPACPLSPVKASEQIQVVLLIMEARLQAELLYALRAITQYMVA